MTENRGIRSIPHACACAATPVVISSDATIDGVGVQSEKVPMSGVSYYETNYFQDVRCATCVVWEA